MSAPVENLVSRLHAKRSGKGWIAKCPAHDDHTPSLSIDEGSDGRLLLKCHAGCSTNDVIAALGLTLGDLFVKPNTTYQRQSTNGAFDWQKCVDAFTDVHVERIAKWRGFSVEFVKELRDSAQIGIYSGLVAFPVRDDGKVVGAHFRLENGDWNYAPTGIKAAPLVFGELTPGERVQLFESTWDGLDYLDKSGERDGVIITRGSANGKLGAVLIPQGSTAYVWTQNDAPSAKCERDICANTKATVKRVRIPIEFKDLNDWTRGGASTKDLLDAMANAETMREAEKPLIEFRSPLQLQNFVAPPGIVLVGDCHIVKGSAFVIGGAPGVGKSRSSVTLAVGGATRSDWFGLRVHRPFKTMIIQSENGEFRLSKEFRELDCDTLDAYIRVCPPPPYGLCFQRDEFRAQLAAAIAQFKPDIVIYDPWNAAARDEKAREYLETFDALRSVLPLANDAPALGIVAHTRKPKTDERASGRALLNLLAGSYVLGSVPRSVFVMQAASDETTDNRIVWTCCKNNDGDLGARSAWERRNGLFAPLSQFDWDSFDNPRSDERVTITADDIAEVFDNGQKQLTRADAAKALQTLMGAGRTACYAALKTNGRFAGHLGEADGLLSWKA